VVMRPVGGGPSNIDEWPAFLPFGQLRSLLRQAGYGEPLTTPSAPQTGPPDHPDTPPPPEGSQRPTAADTWPLVGGA